MSKDNKKKRRDVHFHVPQYDFVEDEAKKRKVSFAQVVRELLDIAIPLYKSRNN